MGEFFVRVFRILTPWVCSDRMIIPAGQDIITGTVIQRPGLNDLLNAIQPGDALEPVYNLFRISTAKARTTICRLVLSFLSQFFQRRRHCSSQPKDRSTTHRFGSTTKVCSSLPGLYAF